MAGSPSPFIITIPTASLGRGGEGVEVSEACGYLLGRGLLSVGVIVGEGPVEGCNVQTAVSTGKEAQPGLASGRVARGGVGELQTLRNALHQHGSKGMEDICQSQRARDDRLGQKGSAGSQMWMEVWYVCATGVSRGVGGMHGVCV